MRKTLIEIATQIHQDNPTLVENLNERKIAKIIREALIQIKTDVENTENSVVKIPQFGSFRARMIEREKEGEKTVIKRIFFTPALK